MTYKRYQKMEKGVFVSECTRFIYVCMCDLRAYVRTVNAHDFLLVPHDNDLHGGLGFVLDT
jgi:hypothetical protein